MTPQDFQSVQELFLRAKELPEAERQALLASEVDWLRAEVESLLAAADDGSDFLERTEVFDDRTWVTPKPRLSERLSEGLSEDNHLAASENTSPPTRIGPYQIEELLGEGGFGEVYRALQLEPLRRQVAVKLIKPGMDTKQVLNRFQAERQALAVMKHPSIAGVFDAGSTEQGTPYFVMELVEGRPIDAFCREQSLSLHETLGVFLQVCEAVQHAHQKGVIHRDIKPSNVLVTQVEGKPLVKVIDFGIAKALDSRLVEEAQATQWGQMIGTLEYMSPEQADPASLDVDTRSDIYSLGVLLYQLLTGRPPLEKSLLLKNGFYEIMQQLRETEPMAPSAALGKTAASTVRGSEASPEASSEASPEASPEARSATPRFPRWNADLDWVTLKALAKNPDHRYSSATEFAEDVHRFLQGQAVTAHPPSWNYRLSKVLRRHWLASTAATAILAGVLLGIAGLIYGIQEAQNSRVQLAEEVYPLVLESSWESTQQRNVAKAREQLSKCLPALRGWEWYFVQQSLDRQSTKTLRDPQARLSSGSTPSSTPQTAASVLDITVAPEQDRLACVTSAGEIEIVNMEMGQLEHRLQLSSRGNVARWAPDGTTLAVGTSGGTIHVFDSENWTQISENQLLMGGVYDLAYSPDGAQLAVCTGAFRAVVLVDHATKIDFEWKLQTRFAQLRWSPEGDSFVAAGFDGGLHVLRPGNTEVDSRSIQGSMLSAIEWLSPTTLVAATAKAIVQVDLSEGNLLSPEVLVKPPCRISALTVCDAERILVSGSDGSIYEYVPDRRLRKLEELAFAISQCVWLPETQEIVASLSDGRLIRLDAPSRDRGWSQRPTRAVAGAAISTLTNTCAVLGGNGKLTMFELKQGEETHSVRVDESGGWALHQSTNETTVAALGSGRKIRVMELPKVDAISQWNVGWGVRTLCVSHDGRWLVAGPPAGQELAEGTMAIWDCKTGECQGLLQAHGNWVMCMALSPEGRLATGDVDGVLRIWNGDASGIDGSTPPLAIETGRAVPDFLLFDRMSANLLVGHRDGKVTVWNERDGSFQGEWQAFGDRLTGMQQTIDGRILVTCRSENQLKIATSQAPWSLASLPVMHQAIEFFHAETAGRHLLFQTGQDGEGMLTVMPGAHIP